MTISKESKRIEKITVKRIVDYDGDSSWLGEYDDRNAKDFAIVATGEYAGQFVDQLPCECEHDEAGHYGDNAETDGPCKVDGCECEEFDRVDVHGDSRICRYFNPNAENYKGESDEDIRKYCLQDFERMQGYNTGEWSFIGIKAEAQIVVAGLCQTITSGGIWGIESDSDRDHFRMIESEEIDQLKSQLHAIGFSKRAISAAMRNVETKDA